MTQTKMKKKRRQKGNVALMTAITFVPTVGLMGAATDVVRSTTEAARLRSALEGAALAAASLTNTRPIEDVIAEYVAANVSDSTARDSLQLTIPDPTVALNKREVTITASMEVKTYFLGLFGIDTMKVSAQTTAIQSATNVELAMVLDISSSMSGQKLSSLKVAAADFVDKILNEKNISRTSVSLIPFGGTVNIQNLFDTYAIPATHSSAIVDPGTADYGNGSYWVTLRDGSVVKRWHANYGLPDGLFR
ncbi:MAG: vWA domain-containing protein, partial [Pseudomonadota bacterium]